MYYDDRTTATTVEVCFRDVAAPETFDPATNCTNVTVNDNLDQKTITAPEPLQAGVPGNYFVTIEHVGPFGIFALDAVQIVENDFSEGIYDAAYINSVTGATLSGNNIELAAGQTIDLNVDADMVGFSFLLQHTLTTSEDYDVRVFDTATDAICDFNDSPATPETDCLGYELWPITSITNETVPTSGASALTYAGMHNVTGDATYTVQLHNVGPGILRFSEFHVLGDDDTPTLTDPLLIIGDDPVENNDPQIRSLPFGSVVEEVNKLGDASEQSQHRTNQHGALLYFEFDDDDITTQHLGFEYVRQVGLFGYGTAEVCYGRIGDGAGEVTDTLFDVRSTNCTLVDNTIANAFRVSEVKDTLGVDHCESNGCWATVRNIDGNRMTFDFTRLFDASVERVLKSGFYEPNDSLIDYIDGADGVWELAIPNINASGNLFDRVQVTDDAALRNEDSPIATFLMDGTGFTVYFLANIFADAVNICYIPYTGSESALDALTDGSCQVFDNESPVPVFTIARRVVGLPDDTYRVAVQMMPDNGIPAIHLLTARPYTMVLDAIEIHDTDWAATNTLAPGTRYETHYRNRFVDNNFTYLGGTWITAENPVLTAYSSNNYDRANQYGATIVFNTNGGDAITFYANAAATNADFRICVTTVGGTTTRCQDYTQIVLGTRIQAPFSFRFEDFGIDPAADNIVSITTLNRKLAFFDAIEINTTTDTVPEPLTEGTYEATDARLFYDSVYDTHVFNGNMEVNNHWSIVGSATRQFRTIGQYQGRFFNRVFGSTGDGIASEAFKLSGNGGRYTLVAHVRVLSGSARLKLVEGGRSFSIPEFDEVTVDTGTPGWQTLRVDFTIPSGLYNEFLDIASDGLQVRIVADDASSIFDVDAITLNTGGLWEGEYLPAHSDGNVWISQTHGASMMFALTGTGFGIRMADNLFGGEMELCYVTETQYQADIGSGDGFQSGNCFTHDQLSVTVNRLATTYRTVSGLPRDTYYVRVRDVEDRTRPGVREIAKMAIDFISIYDDPFVSDAITQAGIDGVASETYYTVPPGLYNEDARNEVTGELFLRLTPAENWKTITGVAAQPYSEGSFFGAVDALQRLDLRSAGQSASLYIEVPPEGATVVINTGLPNANNSSQLLVCASDALTGDGYSGEVLVQGSNISLVNSTDCIVQAIRTSNTTVISGDDVPALDGSAPGPKRILFTTLTTGLFYIDSYQVIHGNTLTAGMYDDVLPDILLNFETTTANEAVRLPQPCNIVVMDNNWCEVKNAAYFGRSALLTQSLDATLEFNIRGTGFSVITHIGAGADFTLCYARTPVDGSNPSWPDRSSVVDGSKNLIWDNSIQNLDEGGIYCEALTSNRIRWNVVFPDRLIPLGFQYGFSYYGLPENDYSVQIRMIDGPLLGANINSLKIDAIAVFDDYFNAPALEPGFYDSADAPISYEPAAFWNARNFVFPPPSGAFGKSDEITNNAGAIAQMQVNGNAVTLYQTISAVGSRDNRICLLITFATIHCTGASDTSAAGIVNPPLDSENEPVAYALAVDMANFSQFSAAARFFTPIMFYGLGEGPHQLIIENRDHNRITSIDAIHVHD